MLDKADAEAEAVLFKNRLGAPTRPHKNLDDLLKFLSGSKTYEQLADFISYAEAMDVNKDQQAGLDSWMGPNDQRMLKYY